MYNNAMTSQYYPWFVELGYPQLDVVFYEDREWAIIEFENAPLVPSQTKWRVIFSGFRNVEFNKSFVKKMIEMIDLERREYWERMEEEEAERAQAEESAINARADLHSRAAKEICRNDALMERAAKQGPSAFSLDSILREMSPHQIRNVLGSQVQTFC
jgi:hypothetical protein